MKVRRVGDSEELALPVNPKKWEEEGFVLGYKHVAGLDEVGRGPLAGPVMAAAVVFPRGLVHPEITDSKLLSPKKREALIPWIKEHALGWGIGSADPEEIDRINILQASLLAMARSVHLLELKPDYLLIDGIYGIPQSYLINASVNDSSRRDGVSVAPIHPNPPYTNNSVPYQRTVKHGDRLCLSIAAASILAKVERDRLMTDYDRCYPEYGFAGHKGYGSALHLRAIRDFGPSPIHRKSFKPVREFTERKTTDQQPLFRSLLTDP